MTPERIKQLCEASYQKAHPRQLVVTKPQPQAGWLPVGVCAHPTCTNVREYLGAGLGYAPFCGKCLGG